MQARVVIMSTRQVHAKVKGNCDPFGRQMKVKMR